MYFVFLSKLHFHWHLLVMSDESSAVLVLCLGYKHVFVSPVTQHHLNAKDTSVEKALLSHNVTTKVLVK